MARCLILRRSNINEPSDEQKENLRPATREIYWHPASRNIHRSCWSKAVKIALSHIKEEVGVLKGMKVLKMLNQFDGFDCPGCAWPDPDEKRAFLAEYCENGAKAVAEEATTKKADPSFFTQHSVEALGEWSDFELSKSGRLTHPMVLREGETHYRAISWTDAFGLIASELNALGSPDEAIFYTSGRTGNEAAFVSAFRSSVRYQQPSTVLTCAMKVAALRSMPRLVLEKVLLG